MSKIKTHLYKGKIYSLLELAKMVGLHPTTIKARMKQKGMDLETAVDMPCLKRKTYNYRGKEYILKRLPCDIPVGRLYTRIHVQHWSVERAVETPLPVNSGKPTRAEIKRLPMRIQLYIEKLESLAGELPDET